MTNLSNMQIKAMNRSICLYVGCQVADYATRNRQTHKSNNLYISVVAPIKGRGAKPVTLLDPIKKSGTCQHLAVTIEIKSQPMTLTPISIE